MLSVAWTDFFQCLLLMGGGLYVFFAGMHHLDWDFAAVISSGQRAHLIAPQSHEVPWTALVILALSTNVWYYATDQFINQRCLGAKNEWHSKMGVLFAGGLQLLLPLATAAPGMIYYVMNPTLPDHNAAYTSVVAELIPTGLRGLVVAAVIGAIMSTISGLVNSTSTMVTLDLFRRWKGKDWPEHRLVRFGQWSGTAALVDRRPLCAGGHEMGQHFPLLPGHLGPDGGAGGGRLRRRGALAARQAARRRRLPAAGHADRAADVSQIVSGRCRHPHPAAEP